MRFRFFYDTLNDVESDSRLKNIPEDHEFSVLMNLVPAAVWITRDPQCRRIIGNRLAYEFTNSTEGRNISQSAPDEERPPFHAVRNGVILPPEELPMQKCMATGQPVWNDEHILVFPDGSRRILLINAIPLFDDEGKVRGGLASGLDITERYETEQKLEAAKLELRDYALQLELRVTERTSQLQEMISELESFSYSVSHDLRAPLRGIEGYATSLLEDYAAELSEEAVRRLNRIQQAAVRLDHLVREILSYSRAFREPLELKVLSLEEVIHTMILMYPQLDSKKEFIEVRRPLHHVYAHEVALTQCLSNLIQNALKFTDEGVTPRIILRSEETVLGTIKIWVEDNGIGIDPRHHKQIFELFHQVNLNEGTGIGLAIVKKAVHKMNGQVGVESVPGQGSKFWLELKGTK